MHRNGTSRLCVWLVPDRPHVIGCGPADAVEVLKSKGHGVGTRAQVAPSQCSANGTMTHVRSGWGRVPTIHASLGASAATPFWAYPGPDPGCTTELHASPFQCSNRPPPVAQTSPRRRGRHRRQFACRCVRRQRDYAPRRSVPVLDQGRERVAGARPANRPRVVRCDRSHPREACSRRIRRLMQGSGSAPSATHCRSSARSEWTSYWGQTRRRRQTRQPIRCRVRQRRRLRDGSMPTGVGRACRRSAILGRTNRLKVQRRAQAAPPSS